MVKSKSRKSSGKSLRKSAKKRSGGRGRRRSKRRYVGANNSNIYTYLDRNSGKVIPEQRSQFIAKLDEFIEKSNDNEDKTTMENMKTLLNEDEGELIGDGVTLDVLIDGLTKLWEKYDVDAAPTNRFLLGRKLRSAKTNVANAPMQKTQEELAAVLREQSALKERQDASFGKSFNTGLVENKGLGSHY